MPDAKPVWIKPDEGRTGNHIFISFGKTVFDYHGYSDQELFLSRYWKREQHYDTGWKASLIEINREARTAEGPSAVHADLWLRAPRQFFQNALPRAEEYLDRFPVPSEP